MYNFPPRTDVGPRTVRLRGCYVFVVEAGQVQVGDPVRKL